MQAFGYAVKEQVALFTVCNYEMTFFIKRSAVPGDKTIFVSDPIFYNRQGPSARSFWLAFLLLSRARFAGAALCLAWLGKYICCAMPCLSDANAVAWAATNCPFVLHKTWP